MNGLNECILCACCSTACPSYWWSPDKFVGPAGLQQAYRFIADTRNTAQSERLNNLNDAYCLFRCRTIMDCVDVCPKRLSPSGPSSKYATCWSGERYNGRENSAAHEANEVAATMERGHRGIFKLRIA